MAAEVSELICQLFYGSGFRQGRNSSKLAPIPFLAIDFATKNEWLPQGVQFTRRRSNGGKTRVLPAAKLHSIRQLNGINP